MDYLDYITDALDRVSAWEVPAEEFAQAVNAQARIMAGMDLEPSTDILDPSPYTALHF